LPRESSALRGYQPALAVSPCARALVLSEDPGVVRAVGGGDGHCPTAPPSSSADTAAALVAATYRFSFDEVYPPSASQADVYAAAAAPAVRAVLAGYNAAVIAYGQTGAGKTHTMEGLASGEGRGIIPRAVEDAFAGIQADAESGGDSAVEGTTQTKFLVRASYLQIYNESVSDLLRPERANLPIREDARRGVFVDGLSEWVVRSPAEVHALMQRGRDARATGATRLNEASSRSHAVLTITVERCAVGGEDETSSGASGGEAPASSASSSRVRVGKLHLVDLAGSERVSVTGATGRRLEESKRINQSLSALGNVIAALTDPKRRGGGQVGAAGASATTSTSTTTTTGHIPYRDSKLTRLLEDSLGGNCVTTLVATVSPSACSFAESLSTLKFATRAKTVVNAPRVNEDVGDQRTLLRKYELELRRLRAELRERAKTLVDKRALLELEEGRRRAEADKLAAVTALEARSREVLAEKAEKRRLEARIAAMQSQLLVGGVPLEDSPAFRSRLAAEHARIRAQYEARLKELEAERARAVGGGAVGAAGAGGGGGPSTSTATTTTTQDQADRYVALLKRQRDIMTGLTHRLAERDGQLQALQAEVDAYDGRIQRLEDALDARTAELLALRRVVAEGAAASAAAGPSYPPPPPVVAPSQGPPAPVDPDVERDDELVTRARLAAMAARTASATLTPPRSPGGRGWKGSPAAAGRLAQALERAGLVE
jgi:hypothetical protein